MANSHHPVWIVYDLYKTARLNVKYHAARLGQVERDNFAIELLIAITAPTSAITGLWLLQTESGQVLWKYIAALAAIAAVVKPLLRLPQKIKSLEQTLSGYRALEYDVEQIVNRIKSEGAYSRACRSMLDEAQKKKKSLVCNPAENNQNKKLIERLYSEVNQELPMESFYVPEKDE
ncbi:hypothetical protein [Accumulibacter sp.]|uniref:hypothetical protein n=1 Tax=Accumulibacter sp. TaxID=2053492 RepID=UPI002616E1D9|nr:hypothetical protein [Accumulibacter sp.]